jgi:hypothetical protein
MPAKSRRNRRPQARREVSGQGGSNIASTSNSSANTQASAGQVDRLAVPNNKALKTAVSEAPVGAYFMTEVKWIAVVAAILVVLLIASYYMFR